MRKTIKSILPALNTGTLAGIFRKLIKKEGVTYLLCFLSAFIVMIQSPLRPGAGGVPFIDSGVFIYFGKYAGMGRIPYLDMFDHKGPLLYLFNYIGFTVHGYAGVWLIELFLMSITIFIAYKIARFFGEALPSILSVAWMLLLLIPYFSQGNLVEEYALPFIMLGLYVSIKLINSKKTNDLLFLVNGVAMGAVLLLRPNMIAIWLSFYLIWGVKNLSNKNYKKVLKAAIFSLLGLATTLAPFLIYLSAKGAFEDFIYSYISFNFMYSDIGDGSRYKTFEYFSNNILFAMAASYFTYYLLWMFGVRHKPKLDNILAMVFFIISVALLLSAKTPSPYPHYGIVLLPIYLIPITIIFNAIYKILLDNSIGKVAIIVLMLFSSYLFLGSYVSQYTQNINNLKIKKKNIRNVVIYTKEETSLEDKIIVIGNDCTIYLESNREAASKYIYQVPIAFVDKNVTNNIIDDILSNKPKLIISRTRLDKNEGELAEGFYREVGKVVRNDYEAITDEGNFGVYYVYKIRESKE